MPYKPDYQDHTSTTLPQSMMQGAAPDSLHIILLSEMRPTQHSSPPPGRLLQPVPPHFPHSAEQQISPDCTPGIPLLQGITIHERLLWKRRSGASVGLASEGVRYGVLCLGNLEQAENANYTPSNSTMHGGAPESLHISPLSQIARAQQPCGPPGSFAQPAPPQVPHDVGQQTPFSSIPASPLLHVIAAL